ncbi:MAG: autotransporter outer membrane beta-barrel domain-containing protein [Gammaproteobacteria bacterium]|nr:autotransporter outer membrane beta-barrel domain-containing protein [Gammaproteobacteria bacterium]
MLIGNLRFKRFSGLLWLVLLSGPCFITVNADVVVESLTQSPANPVVAGDEVTYTITVRNTDAATFPDITMQSNGQNIGNPFVSSDPRCSYDAPTFFCDQLAQSAVQTYSFRATATLQGFPAPIEFAVGCSGASVCNGDTVQVNPVTQIVPPGLTPNEGNVSDVLDTACLELQTGTPATEGQANLLAICNELDAAEPDTVVAALQQITPAQMPGQVNLSFQSSSTQLENISTRMSALRGGQGGNSVANLSLLYAGLMLPGELFFGHQQQLGLGVESAVGTPGLVPEFGVFINGTASFGDKDDTANELGFDFNTNGITVGGDYRIQDSLIAGGAVGFVSSDSDFNGSRGDVDTRGLSFLGYGTYYLSATNYLEAVISFGTSTFENTRNVTVGTITNEVRGKTDGNELTLNFGAGFDLARGPFSLSSYGKINYIKSKIDGYSENTNTGLELVFSDQDAESFSTLVGGQLSYAISQQYGVLLPTLRFDWTHEFRHDSRFITASFLNDPTQGQFKIKTDDPDRDYFQLGVGVAATFRDNRSAYLNYEYLLEQDYLDQESVSAGFRMDF